MNKADRLAVAMILEKVAVQLLDEALATRNAAAIRKARKFYDRSTAKARRLADAVNAGR